MEVVKLFSRAVKVFVVSRNIFRLHVVLPRVVKREWRLV